MEDIEDSNTTIQVSSSDDTIIDIMHQRFHKGDIAWRLEVVENELRQSR